MKVFIIILICVLIITILALICYGGNYLYNLGINPKYPKDLIFKNNSNNEETKKEETSGVTSIDSKDWLLHHSDYEDLFLKSRDNLKLHNIVIKNKTKSNKWAITVHGYTSQSTYMASYAQELYNMGYNIVVPDLRGHGKSEGNYIGMGWNERFDIVDLSNYIADNYKDSKIILLGVSMGAATVMSASGEKLPKNVKAIIEDCGYTSAWDQFAYQLKALFKLPTFPMMHAASIICKIRAGYFISEASPIKQIKKSITPTLFIHGDVDKFVPFSMLEKLYTTSPVEKEKLIIPGAAHARASYVNHELYWKTVKKFLEKHVN